MNIKKNLFNRNHQLNWWLWFTFSSEFCLSKNKNTTHYQNYITSIIVNNFTILLNGNISIVDSLEIIKNSTSATSNNYNYSFICSFYSICNSNTDFWFIEWNKYRIIYNKIKSPYNTDFFYFIFIFNSNPGTVFSISSM